MNKKNYILIAQQFATFFNKKENNRGVKFDYQQIKEITNNFCDEFKLDNPNFNKKKFLNICGFKN